MSLRKIILSTTFALFTIGSTSAMAELDIGTNELGFSASIQSPDNSDDILFVAGTFGQMYKPNIQIKGSAFWVKAGGFDFLYLGAGADYLFQETKDELIPYAGGVFNLGLMDAEDESLEFHGGIKKFVSERSSVFVQYSIVTSLDDTAIGLGDYTELRAGLNVYF
jgi:hypothetical protein